MAKEKVRKLTVAEALETWESFNAFLRHATETEASELLAAEQASKRRVQYLLRAHSRFNRQRASRERRVLLQASGS